LDDVLGILDSPYPSYRWRANLGFCGAMGKLGCTACIAFIDWVAIDWVAKKLERVVMSVHPWGGFVLTPAELL